MCGSLPRVDEPERENGTEEMALKTGRDNLTLEAIVSWD